MKTLILLISENSERDIKQGLCFFSPAYKNSSECEFLFIDDAQRIDQQIWWTSSLKKVSYIISTSEKTRLPTVPGAIRKLAFDTLFRTSPNCDLD